jgi:hypothetical protein
LSTAKADVGGMLGGVAFRPKGGPEPIGIIEIGPPPLDLRGPLRRASGIDGGLRRVGRFVVPVGYPFVEIAGQIVNPIGTPPHVAIADRRDRLAATCRFLD